MYQKVHKSSVDVDEVTEIIASQASEAAMRELEEKFGVLARTSTTENINVRKVMIEMLLKIRPSDLFSICSSERFDIMCIDQGFLEDYRQKWGFYYMIDLWCHSWSDSKYMIAARDKGYFKIQPRHGTGITLISITDEHGVEIHLSIPYLGMDGKNTLEIVAEYKRKDLEVDRDQEQFIITMDGHQIEDQQTLSDLSSSDLSLIATGILQTRLQPFWQHLSAKSIFYDISFFTNFILDVADGSKTDTLDMVVSTEYIDALLDVSLEAVPMEERPTIS